MKTRDLERLEEIKRLLKTGNEGGAVQAMRIFFGLGNGKRRKRSWQQPEPKLHKRKGKPGTWKTRYRLYLKNGGSRHLWEAFGDETEFPNKTAVMASGKYRAFIKRINNREERD